MKKRKPDNIFKPIRIIDLELSDPSLAIDNSDGVDELKCLVRFHGVPLGFLHVGANESISKESLHNQFNDQISTHLFEDALASISRNGESRKTDLRNTACPTYQRKNPALTVAVCTRNRPDNLRQCLEVLNGIGYKPVEILIIDNAPDNMETRELVQNHFPKFHYICEPRPGLNWARNRAIIEAKGELIAFTDDDALPDPEWVNAIVQAFTEDPDVMAVTGLVIPLELETDAQILFENFGGFGCGFKKRRFKINSELGDNATTIIRHIADLGTGANMAFRRELFERIGLFDPGLDVGTVTNGGGDLEFFFRTLKEGFMIVYEPRVIVRHLHRRKMNQLYEQIENWGISYISCLVRCAKYYPEEKLTLFWKGCWWFYKEICRLLRTFSRPGKFPAKMISRELKGALKGLSRYQMATKDAQKIEHIYGAHPGLPAYEKQTQGLQSKTNSKFAVAIRKIELLKPLPDLADIRDYPDLWVFVTLNDNLLGKIAISNKYQSVSAAHLREAVAYQLKEVPPESFENPLDQEQAKEQNASQMLPNNVSVSIIISTYDRPNDLRSCLQSIMEQVTSRPAEVIVVDNHPSSGITPEVLKEFPDVVLINEARKGSSFGRNAGISFSIGDIIVTVDDDVTMPSDWLEKLVAPFINEQVMTVTGNILPFEIETSAQRLFEVYGGLGRGFKPFKADKNWLDGFKLKAVPTWDLGATANAAFRSEIFRDPEIGFMDEALGAGVPTGCSEDTYLFYKVMKSGFTIIYEPKAYVWHKHRRNMEDFRRQIYNYSKGHVAYHLTTLFNDKDYRVLFRLFIEMPLWYMWQLKGWLLRKHTYPLGLIILELLGNLSGPLALWRSRWYVKRVGKSNPYIARSKKATEPLI